LLTHTGGPSSCLLVDSRQIGAECQPYPRNLTKIQLWDSDLFIAASPTSDYGELLVGVGNF